MKGGSTFFSQGTPDPGVISTKKNRMVQLQCHYSGRGNLLEHMGPERIKNKE
jgi:hypothetical protein